MDIYANNYTCYHYYSDGTIRRPATNRCPYCRHEMPECDCGYGLLALDPQPSVMAAGIKKFFTLVYLAGKKLFAVRIHRTPVQSRQPGL